MLLYYFVPSIDRFHRVHENNYNSHKSCIVIVHHLQVLRFASFCMFCVISRSRVRRASKTENALAIADGALALARELSGLRATLATVLRRPARGNNSPSMWSVTSMLSSTTAHEFTPVSLSNGYDMKQNLKLWFLVGLFKQTIRCRCYIVCGNEPMVVTNTRDSGFINWA